MIKAEGLLLGKSDVDFESKGGSRRKNKEHNKHVAFKEEIKKQVKKDPIGKKGKAVQQQLDSADDSMEEEEDAEDESDSDQSNFDNDVKKAAKKTDSATDPKSRRIMSLLDRKVEEAKRRCVHRLSAAET